MKGASMDFQIERVVGNYPNNALLSIWKESYPDSNEIDEKRIKWTYQDNIYGKAQVWLLKDKINKEYFGCSTLIPRYFFIKGEKSLGALFADTGIKKRYRSLGPALKLHREIVNNSDDFKFILAFPNEISEAILRKLKFKKGGDLVYNIKVLKTRLVLEKKIKNKFAKNVLYPFARIVDSALHLYHCHIRGNNKKFEGQHLMSFDERFDFLSEQAKAKYGFIHDRNSIYMNWRYGNHPYRNYHIFVINDENTPNLRGYVVYYIKENRVFVDDFFWLEEYCTLEDLLNIFIKTMQKKGKASISFDYIENSKLQKTFKKMGFLRTDYKIPIYYFASDQALNAKISDQIRNAFITLGDRDF
jgi:hypothetical protein